MQYSASRDVVRRSHFSLDHFDSAPEERGASMVEFAVCLPLITILLFGIVQYGLIFASYNSLKELSAMGARYAVLDPRPSTNAVAAFVTQIKSPELKDAYFSQTLTESTVVGSSKKARSVELTYTMPVFFPVPGTAADGTFLLKTQTTMR